MISMNTDQIKARIADIKKEYERKKEESPDHLADGVKRCCRIVENEAKINLGSHVRTGTLRRSITHTVESDKNHAEGVVGTNIFYAPYVEYGTGIFAAHGDGRKTGWYYVDEKGVGHFTRGGRPVLYMTRAAEANKEKCEEILVKAVADAIKDRA